MILKMLFKLFLLTSVLVLNDAADEGDRCTKENRAGVCTSIGKCKSAIEDLKNKVNPQLCGFNGAEPIVCCIENFGVGGNVPPSPTTITTTRRPFQTSTTESLPSGDECEAIDPSMTSKKTGQKAFDKCIEYQDKYVYPCEESVSLAAVGDMSRVNNCHHNADQLVLGGVDASLYEFPHMVLLGYGDNPQSLSWLCGGTIISDQYILTAAHCVSTNALGDVAYVLVGAHTRSDAQNPSKLYKVARIIKHPEYASPIKYNDIALLQTEKPIKLSQYVVPACLHIGDPVEDDEVLATGWGLTKYKGSLAEVMQKVILHKFSMQECSVKYPGQRLMLNGIDPKTQICYGDRTEVKDTCQGDSGGPLQIKTTRIHCMYTIVALTSFGKACGFPGEPAVYTRVAHYVPWIESVVWP